MKASIHCPSCGAEIATTQFAHELTCPVKPLSAENPEGPGIGLCRSRFPGGTLQWPTQPFIPEPLPHNLVLADGETITASGLLDFITDGEQVEIAECERVLEFLWSNYTAKPDLIANSDGIYTRSGFTSW